MNQTPREQALEAFKEKYHFIEFSPHFKEQLEFVADFLIATLKRECEGMKHTTENCECGCGGCNKNGQVCDVNSTLEAIIAKLK